MDDTLGGRAFDPAPLRWRRGQGRLRAGFVIVDEPAEYDAVIDPDRIRPGQPNVLRDLAALSVERAEPTGAERRRRLLRFVEDHGLLTASREGRERVEDFYRAADGVAMLLALHVGLHTASAGRRHQQLYDDWSRFLALQAPQAADNPPEHYPLLLTHALLLPGVNRGVGGVGGLRDCTVQVEVVSRAVDWRRPNLGFAIRAPNLLGLAYLQLAFLVTGGVPLLTCKDPACGRVFMPEHSLQEFCEPAHSARYRGRRAQRERRSKAPARAAMKEAKG
jgi:hypothetical protein